MDRETKKQITKISKQFANGFKGTFGNINEAGWMIIDPLSGYLNACGFEHTIGQLPKCDKHPQILILTFPDGDQFIPTGADLKSIHPKAKNWMWI